MLIIANIGKMCYNMEVSNIQGMRFHSRAIQRGLKDFYRPVLDPSFSEDGGICYAYGRKPAVGKSYNWWEKTAIEFMPDRGSRLGTRTEYVAFLGVLLKKLIKKGWIKAEAWEAVCNDSRELGHYRDSENAKNGFELTGSREIFGYYDLANACKILKMDVGFHDNCWIAGGSYSAKGYWYPLADIGLEYEGDHDYEFVGWLVLEK